MRRVVSGEPRGSTFDVAAVPVGVPCGARSCSGTAGCSKVAQAAAQEMRASRFGAVKRARAESGGCGRRLHTGPVNPEHALRRIQANGVPVESLALYGRWWQLEVWLRQLAYLVLHAAWGDAWETEVNKKAAAYAANDNLVHLVGPDQPDLLGYLDFGLLLQLFDDNWRIFEPFLLQRVVWDGRAVEMRSIRNRVGHVRRSGARDRERVEHLLSDLEPGFRGALKAVATRPVDADRRWTGDPVAADYATGRLGGACDHLRRKYGFDVELGVSEMPWAEVPPSSGNLSGVAGVLWQLSIGGPGRLVFPSRLADMIQPVRENVVYVFAGTGFGAQLAVPAVDDVETILRALTHFAEGYPSCAVPLERVSTEDVNAWPGDVDGLDSRVLVEHLFAIALSFDAPGGVFGV